MDVWGCGPCFGADTDSWGAIITKACEAPSHEGQQPGPPCDQLCFEASDHDAPANVFLDAFALLLISKPLASETYICTEIIEMSILLKCQPLYKYSQCYGDRVPEILRRVCG